MQLNFIILVIFSLPYLKAKFISVPTKFDYCNPDDKIHYIDWRNVEIILLDDGVTALNGTAIFLKEIRSPWNVKLLFVYYLLA